MEPVVVTEVAAVTQQALLGDGRRNRALPGIVADVMIAGNGAKPDIEVGMTARGEREVVIPIGTVEADVTRVDDKIRSARGDDARHRSKIRGNQGRSRPRCVSET